MLVLVLLALLAPAAVASAQAPAPDPAAPPAPAAPAAPAPAAPAAGGAPTEKALYRDGPSGRHLLDGTWLFRADPASSGDQQGFQRQATTDGWAPTSVPNAWNATDESVESFTGGVGWYRKDFKLPSAASRLDWIVRFESVNYRSKVWLNGRPLGTHRGAYLPFELRLPASALKRTGTNRLVVRVDNRRLATDFPPSGLSDRGTPTGGWWNYGGILREVYLRRVDTVDFSTVQVRPNLPCATCAATVAVRTTVRNHGPRAARVRVAGRFGGQRLDLGTKAVGPGRFATFTRTIRVARPRLWAPGSPNLYDVDLRARVGDRVAQRYRLTSGIRSVDVVGGKLRLNGRELDFRGVGLHEDDPARGFAIDNAVRERVVAEAQELGATILRSHYPLHPYTHELADRLGLMVWSEIPVYALKTPQLAKAVVRRMAARELERNILTNQNHASIVTWSVGNELSARPGPVQGMYLRDAAASAKRLDPTRPVSYAVAGYPSAGCQDEYAPIDLLGINEYFGWYPGPSGSIADRSILGEYLDGVRACYPDKAIAITEFGAEANREGPVEEKGTYAHQQDFVAFHLGVYATKPWLSGAIYWALEEFRVRPGWDGGNPRPNPPIHQKGLISFAGVRKPAFFEAQRLFKATAQLRAAPRR
jgi:beta-glucuronidase